MTAELLPPSDLDAEQLMLGAALLSPTALDAVAEAVTPGDCYRAAHGQILAAAVAVRDAGQVPDPVAVRVELEKRGELLKVGGASYLHSLMERVPTASNAAYYAELVAGCALRRSLMAAGQRAIQLATLPGDPDELVERARASLDNVAGRSRAGVEASPIGRLAEEALIRYLEPDTAALSTPWHDLDAVLSGGLRPGTFNVVAARPGVGKSVLLSNLAVWAAQGGAGVLFVSLEMSEAEVTDRIVSGMARVNFSALRGRWMSDDDHSRVQTAVDKIGTLPLHVADRPYSTLTLIRSLARSIAHNYGLGLIVVDYLQLIHPAESRQPRQEQVAGFSRGLKLLAKELGVPIVAAAQLNRGAEQRADRRPGLADLRESGAIEADADLVILLWRPEDRDDPRHGEMDLILAKNRGGPTSTITVAWAPHYQQIYSMAAA